MRKLQVDIYATSINSTACSNGGDDDTMTMTADSADEAEEKKKVRRLYGGGDKGSRYLAGISSPVTLTNCTWDFLPSSTQ
ncbi:hypothetical protein ABZP36_028519 [Zizania latifolia]